MSKKKKKQKKISAKREKYAKFRKEKPATVDFSPPDLTDEQREQKKQDETKIDKYLRFNKNKPVKPIVERQAKSKR